MAPAARLARAPEPAPTTARRALASVVALGLALAPVQAVAAPGGAAEADPTTDAEPAAPDADAPAPPAEADPDAPASEADPDADAEDVDAVEELDPEAEDGNIADGEDDETAAPQGEPLRPLQTAAWWTMFGAFSVGTTAGVLAGLAERQEDRATRLSTLFDAETGAQPRYADRQDEYEGYLRRGEAYARAAIGVGVVAGVTTIAAITLFAIDARRQRAETPRARSRAALRLHPGGMEVRF